VAKPRGPEEEERPRLEADNRRLMKAATETTGVCVCVCNSDLWSVVKTCVVRIQ
jgi:hypothetical protein